MKLMIMIVYLMDLYDSWAMNRMETVNYIRLFIIECQLYSQEYRQTDAGNHGQTYQDVE